MDQIQVVNDRISEWLVPVLIANCDNNIDIRFSFYLFNHRAHVVIVDDMPWHVIFVGFMDAIFDAAIIVAAAATAAPWFAVWRM